MALTTHSQLAPRLRKRVGLFLFVACSRVNFTFTFTTGSLADRQVSNGTTQRDGSSTLSHRSHHLVFNLYTRYVYTSMCYVRTFDCGPSSAINLSKLNIAAFQPGHRAELSGLPRRQTDGSRMDVGGAAIRQTHGVSGLSVRD